MAIKAEDGNGFVVVSDDATTLHMTTEPTIKKQGTNELGFNATNVVKYGINDKMRFVITAVTLENAMAGLDSLKNVGISGDIVQVAVSKGRQIGDLHMLMAQNPIFIISGSGAHE